MEFSPSTSTPRFSTTTLQFIDRPFDDRLIRKKRFEDPLELASQMKKRLPKPTEFLPV
jgi:hypothetical protein